MTTTMTLRQVSGPGTREVADPMRAMMLRQLIKYAVQRAIFCPFTGKVMDARTAVVLIDGTDDVKSVMHPDAWPMIAPNAQANFPTWWVLNMPVPMCVVVTVQHGKGTRRYVVADEDASKFADMPTATMPTPERIGDREPSIADVRHAREDALGRFSFGCMWLRSAGRVDECYRTLSTWEVVRMAWVPRSKVYGS